MTGHSEIAGIVALRGPLALASLSGMTLSIWQQAHRKRATAYDVVVVGAGIAGCSTAYWLTRRRPSLRVALVDARTLGAGASGRNAGFVIQGVDTDYLSAERRYGERTARRLWHFTRANRDLMASELQGSVFGWTSDGSMRVAGTEEEAEQLRASVAHLRAAGAPVVYRNAETTNDRLRGQDLHGGLYVTTGAVVNPLRLVRHIAAESEVHVRTQHPVESIHWAEDGVTLETPDVELWGRRVVLAVGAALPTLVPDLSRFVRPVRAQMLATSPAEEASIPLPVYSHQGEFYVRQLDTGAVLAGGGRHQHRAAEETPVDDTTPAVQGRIERYLHTHFPWTQSLSIRQRWSGTMGFSPDGRPVVGPVPAHPDSLFVTGFTGHGMAYGFRMGRLLADRLCGTPRRKEYDLFAASRFSRTPDGSPSAASTSSSADS